MCFFGVPLDLSNQKISKILQNLSLDSWLGSQSKFLAQNVFGSARKNFFALRAKFGSARNTLLFSEPSTPVPPGHKRFSLTHVIVQTQRVLFSRVLFDRL